MGNSVALLKILKQINCVRDNYSSDEDDEGIYNECMELRRLIIDWLIECNTKAKVDNQE